ncbi:uncharacterized protein LOC122432426 [Cervus canadensis]|uniref:uncharacterized protein LOC122432426 n=1 Tax=Cervus canadensis TaxID=1574408 RepID=UPI001CA370D2|nr:uncharacterized protein LOC122432426 [Cervus canadensis]
MSPQSSEQSSPSCAVGSRQSSLTQSGVCLSALVAQFTPLSRFPLGGHVAGRRLVTLGSADVHLRTGRPGRALHRRPVRRAPASDSCPLGYSHLDGRAASEPIAARAGRRQRRAPHGARARSRGAHRTHPAPGPCRQRSDLATSPVTDAILDGESQGFGAQVILPAARGDVRLGRAACKRSEIPQRSPRRETPHVLQRSEVPHALQEGRRLTLSKKGDASRSQKKGDSSRSPKKGNASRSQRRDIPHVLQRSEVPHVVRRREMAHVLQVRFLTFSKKGDASRSQKKGHSSRSPEK